MEKNSLAHRRRWYGAILAAVVLAAALLVRALPAPAADGSLFRDIDQVLNELSAITGWKIRKPVPAEFISKEQLRGFIERRIKEEVKPEDIRVEELALKLFGLVPQDFDLKKTTVDLISEQAAAFYDPRKKKLSIIETPGTGLEQQAALAHELAHALADQQYHLERFIRKASENDDAATARQAVMEGQATWLMWAYVNRAGGGEATVGPMAMSALEGIAEATSAQYPALENAPLYMRESLFFPYTRGLRFQDAVFQKLGKRAFSEVFERPPTSTRHILHPDEYLANRDWPIPELPAVPDSKSYRKLAAGTLGEFDLYILLRQFGNEPDAKRIAESWRGGAFEVLETKRDKHPLLAFTTVWKSSETANEFFSAYREVMRKKWSRFEEAVRAPDCLEGTGDHGRFTVRMKASSVTSLEGLL